MANVKCDLVLHDAQIFGCPASDGIAITDGAIVTHGKFAELKALVGPRTHIIRLGGRTIAPGFIDSHLHYLEAASVFSGVQLSKARTLGDLFLELRAAAARTAPGNWLKAFGCDEALLRDRRGPTRSELDEAVTKNPLRLRHQTLHASWLNSRAIAALGLEKPDFIPPDGANLVRDSAGRLTGLVVGMEQWLTARLPPVTAADLEARVRLFSRELSAQGVTSFTDANYRNGLDEVKLFGRLIADRAISQRVGLMIGAPHLESIDELRAAADRAQVGLAAAKFIDVAVADPLMLGQTVQRAAAAGLDCAFHATEVEELEAALDAIDAAIRQYGDAGAMPATMRIEHGGVITPDQIKRIAACKAWVVTNPAFIHYRGLKYADQPGLIPYLYRAQSLRRAGINLAGGTDAPVTPPRPLAAISAAVARQSIDGSELAPSERLPIAQAFDLFNASAARLARIRAGEIAPDRAADLIVLQRDPLKIRPAELMNLQVDMTMVGGRVVYERGRPEVAAGIPGQ
jgi:predicted amidohydrolase YtcJ